MPKYLFLLNANEPVVDGGEWAVVVVNAVAVDDDVVVGLVVVEKHSKLSQW